MARGLRIGGSFYANAAAKFWAGFFTELTRDFPDCDEAAFRCTTDHRLQPAMLDPQHALQEALEALEGTRLEDVVREAEIELEAAGPPAAVEIQLLGECKTLLACDLPIECIDNEIFPLLLVWILQWAGVSHLLWNDDVVHGAFHAHDPVRDAGFAIALQLQNTHRAEELYGRELVIRLQ